MIIHSRTSRGVTIVSLEGCLNYEHAFVLFESVQPLVAQPRARILLDLEQVSMISSMGYVVLKQFIRTADEKGSQIRFCNLNGTALENLEIMRFDGLKNAVMTLDEALELLGNGHGNDLEGIAPKL